MQTWDIGISFRALRVLPVTICRRQCPLVPPSPAQPLAQETLRSQIFLVSGWTRWCFPTLWIPRFHPNWPFQAMPGDVGTVQVIPAGNSHLPLADRDFFPTLVLFYSSGMRWMMMRMRRMWILERHGANPGCLLQAQGASGAPHLPSVPPTQNSLDSTLVSIPGWCSNFNST